MTKKQKKQLLNVAVAVLLFLGYYVYDNVFKKPLVQEPSTEQMASPNEIQPSTPSEEAPVVSNETVAQEQAGSLVGNPYLVGRLYGDESSSTDEFGNPLGAAQWGATFILGDLDAFGRATYGHILVSDAQQPGQNGVKREGKITVYPADWKNYKLNGDWVNDRTHTVGFQFGGVNSDKRVLTTAGAYLNRGSEGKGSDQDNPDSMFYYEQRLDSWVATHPNFRLDLYVQPIYEGTSGVVKQMYMQWIGVDENNMTIPINIGGYSQQDGDYYYVLLDNVFPNFNIDYQTGSVTNK